MGWYITDGPIVGQWVAGVLESKYHEENSQAIGLVRDDEFAAGVIYENYNGKSIVCHIAIEGRLTKQYLKYIFFYPFKTCGVNKIIAPVNSVNTKSIKLVENMGFTEESRIKDAAPNGDIIIYTMLECNCRFINYGQKFTKSTASS